MPDKALEFPVPQSDVAKELVPYLQAILMAQAAALEKAGYSLYEDQESSDKNEILDWLIGVVNLKNAKPPLKRATVRRLGGSGSSSLIR